MPHIPTTQRYKTWHRPQIDVCSRHVDVSCVFGHMFWSCGHVDETLHANCRVSNNATATAIAIAIAVADLKESLSISLVMLW
jgi:hypothetical protein